MRAEQYWLEDFTPGRTFPGPSHVLDSEAFGMFAKMTGDAHPLHYDAEYAKKLRRSSVQHWAADFLSASDDLDQASFHEALQYLATGNATDCFELCA